MPSANHSRICPGAPALLLAVLAAACNDGLPTGSTSLAYCAAGFGMTHTGQLSGSQTWTRQNGPHRLVDTVTTGGTITIEAGALVCGTPGSVLVPAVLRVAGSAELPVVLTATDSLAGWGGIRGVAGEDSSVIQYADVRHAESGFRQTNQFGVELASSRDEIRRCAHA